MLDEEGEALHRETLAQRESIHGSTHPATLRSVCDLSECLTYQLCFEEALALLREKIIKCTDIFGEDDPNIRDL